MNKKTLICLLLPLTAFSACSFFAKEDKVKVGLVSESALPQFADGFLWETLGKDRYIDFMSEFRCAAGEYPGFTEKQKDVLAKYNVSEEVFTFDKERPDWFTEYAKTGIEEILTEKTKDLCDL